MHYYRWIRQPHRITAALALLCAYLIFSLGQPVAEIIFLSLLLVTGFACMTLLSFFVLRRVGWSLAETSFDPVANEKLISSGWCLLLAPNTRHFRLFRIFGLSIFSFAHPMGYMAGVIAQLIDPEQKGVIFHRGALYLTTHRLLFHPCKGVNSQEQLAIPLTAIKDCTAYRRRFTGNEYCVIVTDNRQLCFLLENAAQWESLVRALLRHTIHDDDVRMI